MHITRRDFVLTVLASGFSSDLFAKVGFNSNRNQQVTKMKRNVGIFIFDDAEVLDFAGPFEVFSVTSQLNNYEPFDVFTIAKDTNLVRAVNGLKIVPDFSFHNHPRLDVLVLAGGQGTRHLLQDGQTLSWIKAAMNSTCTVVSICSAARVLGKLGFLDNKPYCTHHEVYDHVGEIAPLSIPQREKRFVQTSERLYTSGGISAGIDLSFYMVEKLLGKETALKTAEYMEYRLH
jgi:transcriptional regulator GlxA family with amidase domain